MSTQQDTTTEAASHLTAHVSDQRLGTIHSGDRYTYGYGRDYYGIWENEADAGPIQRYPMTTAGRSEGWARYLELEPGAPKDEPGKAIDTRAEEAAALRRRKTKRRRNWLIFGAIVVIAVVAGIVLSKSGSKGGPAGGGGLTGSGTAHVDLTGGASGSADLTQQSYKATGVDTLYPSANATWTGNGFTIKLVLITPQVGPNGAGGQTQNTLEITDGTGTTYSAAQATDCNVTLDEFDSSGMKGSLDCKGMQSTTTGATATASPVTVDATATFQARP